MEERRRGERFSIQCTVTIAAEDRGKIVEVQRADLQDIGAYGARFHASRKLEIGTRITLDVNFPSPRKGVTTLHFEGVVTRSGIRDETAVEFNQAGKFLKRGFELLQEPKPGKAGSAKILQLNSLRP